MTIQETKNTKNNKNTTQPHDKYQIQPTLTELQLYTNWTHKTRGVYTSTLHGYCQYQQMTLPALLHEAEQDEETITKMSKRRIRQRLLQYILHLQQENYEVNSIRAYVARILKVYRYHDIELPNLPPLGQANVEQFEDIPTRDMMVYALRVGNTRTRALVSLLASSGIRVSDLCELTVCDFMTACNEYSRCSDVRGFMVELLNSNKLIVPTWRIPNQKTGTSYVTFCSDEASRYLAEYLLECLRRDLILPGDKLFGIAPASMSRYFKRLNDRLDFGRLKTRCRFHPHALRRFFATTLTNAGCDFLSVEFMLGHKLSPVQEAYYKADPVRLRQKYMQYLRYVTFLEDIRVRDIKSSELEELEELREWKRDSVERIRHLEEMMNLIDGKL